jgi:REP element-mobilizing transposase RayT
MKFINFYKKLFLPVVDTIAWCLLPNQFHFMVHTDERCTKLIKQGIVLIDPVMNAIRILLSQYAKKFNSCYQKSGSLFRQKTKAICLSDNPDIISPDEYVNCFHNLHQKPVAEGLVSQPGDWEFSSFKDYAGLRNDPLCRKELASLYCRYNPVCFVEDFYERLDLRKLQHI